MTLQADFADLKPLVPGARARGRRSNGCGTCRKRKVKCDEQRPICGRCKNGFHKCLGYDQPRVFVNLGSKSQTPPSTITSPADANTASLSSATALKRNGATGFLAGRSPPLGFSPMLALDGFKNQIVISHLLTKLSIDSTDISPRLSDMTTISAVLGNQDENSAAYKSGLSVAEALFGRLYQVQDMVDHAAQLYGQALGHLRKDLQSAGHSADRARYADLWSCLLLGLYEMVSTSSPTDWLGHSRGVSALTQMAGPLAFQTPQSRYMLDMNRPFILVGAIAERKRSFLEQTAWKTIPWALEPHRKSLGAFLQDIVCDIPGLLEDADAISAAVLKGAAGINEKRDILQSKVLDTLYQTEVLRLRWEEAYPTACWEVAPSRDNSVSFTNEGDPLFTSALSFQSVDLAVEAIHFNILRLLLHSITATAGLPSPFTTQNPPVPPAYMGPLLNPILLPGQGTREENALEICRAVDYMLLGEHDCRGAFALVFPLRVAYGHLGTRPDVLQWLRGLLANISANKGFQIGEHVLGVSPETLNATLRA